MELQSGNSEHQSQRPRWTWLMGRPNSWAFAITGLVTLFVIGTSSWAWTLESQEMEKLMAQNRAVFENHEWWRLWTSLFIHSDVGHLFSNILLLFIFGYLVSGYFGVLVFPFVAILMGGLTNYFVLVGSTPTMNLLGISGVVYWVGAFWLTLYFVTSRQHSVFSRILRTLGVALVIFMPSEAFQANISYSSHAYGFGLGAAAGVVYYGLNRVRLRSAEVYENSSIEEFDFQ